MTTNLSWKKSSRCADTHCVEIAREGEGSNLMRDSKLGDASPVLSFDRAAWAGFLDGIRAGDFTR